MKKSIVYANFGGVEKPTEAQFTTFSKADAMKRAMKAFGICWGVALVCVLVPVLHFVLTPSMLVAGPIAAFIVYNRVQKLPKTIEGRVTCVHCQNAIEFSFRDSKPPLYDTCKSCKTGYEILWPPREA